MDQILKVTGSGIMIFVKYDDDPESETKILLMLNSFDDKYYQECGGYIDYSEDDFLESAKQTAKKELFEETSATLLIEDKNILKEHVIVNNRFICYTLFIELNRNQDLIAMMKKNAKYFGGMKAEFFDYMEVDDWKLCSAWNLPKKIDSIKVHERTISSYNHLVEANIIDVVNKKINLICHQITEKSHRNLNDDQLDFLEGTYYLI